MENESPQHLLDDTQSRLKLDFEIMTLMSNPFLSFEAYRNVDDLRARRRAILTAAEGQLARHYRVEYQIRTLVGRGRYSKLTTVHFDLFADNNYPYSQPACFVIDSEMPWSPHFYPGVPICVGRIWEQAEGSMLLGQLMVHIAKLLNFDEPEYEDPTYGGYNPEAVKYWETTLKRQPITKLIYPQLPEIAHAEPVAAQPRIFVRRTPPAPTAPLIKLRREVAVSDRPARFRIRTRSTNPD